MAMLAACVLIEDVALRDPETGAVVVCPGRAALDVFDYDAALARQRACIERLTGQGYERIPRS